MHISFLLILQPLCFELWYLLWLFLHRNWNYLLFDGLIFGYCGHDWGFDFTLLFYLCWIYIWLLCFFCFLFHFFVWSTSSNWLFFTLWVFYNVENFLPLLILSDNFQVALKFAIEILLTFFVQLLFFRWFDNFILHLYPFFILIFKVLDSSLYNLLSCVRLHFSKIVII